MSRTPVLFLALAALGLTAAPAQARDPLVLEPSSEWVVDFGEARCHLARYFGEGEDRHLLFFQQWQPGRGFSFTAAGPGFRNFRSRRETLVRFRADREPQETEPFVGDIDGGGHALIFPWLSHAPRRPDIEGRNFDETFETSLPQLDIGEADATTSIALRQRSREVVFETGPLGEPFKVLNQCTRDLVKDWGLDPERHLTATRMVRLDNLEEVVRQVQRRYPADALRRGEQGILRIRVMVDETGTPTQCVLNEVTRTERLDSPACDPLMRADFSPALDAEGKPFASYYTTSITYQIGS
jgi:TonB family protein